MKKYTSRLVTVVLFLGLILTWNNCTNKSTDIYQKGPKKAESYYADYCASCHGQKVKDFVNREQWIHGSSKLEMVEVIKNGIDSEGMPAYGEVLSDEQVNALVDYILATIEEEKSAVFNAGLNDDMIFISEGMRLKLELVTESVDSPWAITQSKDGTLFYTDKSGKLYSKLENEIQEISGLPTIKNKGQGGLMDVLLHPDFDNNQRIYLSYSKPKPNDNDFATTAIFSGILNNFQIENAQDIFIAKPYVKTNHHFGSRMVFDNQGYLYVTVGDRGKRDSHPQFLDNYPGKIHRINDNGSIPSDNPFFDTPNAVKSIYSYGHRNPQGLCYNPVTDKLYDNEHGPKGGDEINRIEPGKNYGWPVITFGINYIGTKITDITHKEGMEQPIRYWVPSIATCGMEIVTSDKYPGWYGDILSGSLKFNYLHRDVFDDNDKWIKEEKLFPDIGRMRSIKQCMDGYIYFGLEEPGKIFKIVPI